MTGGLLRFSVTRLTLTQLAHQIGRRVQPAGGVDQREIGADVSSARHHGVEGDGGGIGAALPAHDRDVRALGPHVELLAGRGAKRVR